MAVTVWVVVPLYNLTWSLADSFWVTMIYTVVAIIRGYFVRRYFNAGLHKVAHSWALRLCRKTKVCEDEHTFLCLFNLLAAPITNF